MTAKNFIKLMTDTNYISKKLTKQHKYKHVDAYEHTHTHITRYHI